MEAVEAVKDAKSVLFLGRGISAPVAKEGGTKVDGKLPTFLVWLILLVR